MTPLGVKTCRESEFDIFEAKKRFPDSGKAYYVLRRKVAKMRQKIGTFSQKSNFFLNFFTQHFWTFLDK
jgi:hypothetical protein